jgi:hypothetical protein
LSYGMTGQGAITCTPLPSAPGSSVQGVIWVEYTTRYGGNQITNIATVSAVSR